MRFGAFILLALLLGVLAAYAFMDDTGYVLVQFGGWVLETSFAAALGALLVAVLALHYSMRIIAGLASLPQAWGRLSAKHRRKRGQRLLGRGLTEIAEGRWSEGERTLARGATSSDMPLVNYLGAAVAAQFQGAYERRDRWLKQAHEEQPDATAAVLLTQAQLQFAHEQFEQALATLRRLEQRVPDHAYAMTLLAQLYHRLGDDRALADLLPRLRKLPNLPADRLRALERRTVPAVFANCEDVDAAESRFKALPRDLRDDPDIAAAYARRLAALGEPARAEKQLRRLLDRADNAAVVLAYAELEVDSTAQLERIEKQIILRPHAGPLHLAAARLCRRQQLPGKARDHLQDCIVLDPSVDAYAELAEVLEQLGEREAAREAYRKGLDQALA